MSMATAEKATFIDISVLSSNFPLLKVPTAEIDYIGDVQAVGEFLAIFAIQSGILNNAEVKKEGPRGRVLVRKSTRNGPIEIIEPWSVDHSSRSANPIFVAFINFLETEHARRSALVAETTN